MKIAGPAACGTVVCCGPILLMILYALVQLPMYLFSFDIYHECRDAYIYEPTILDINDPYLNASRHNYTDIATFTVTSNSSGELNILSNAENVVLDSNAQRVCFKTVDEEGKIRGTLVKPKETEDWLDYQNASSWESVLRSEKQEWF